ncbi:MAG: hypothetical protein ACRBBN_07115 [Methyloligellaceae bacterium]
MLISRLMLLVLLILFTGITSPQAAVACELPKDWMRMKTAATPQNNKVPHEVSAALRIIPKTIKVGEPFSVEVIICGLAYDAVDRTSIDASMPAHKHGMNYRPVVKKLRNNIFRGENMLFHMPGVWRIDFAAFQNGKTSRLMLEVDVK